MRQNIIRFFVVISILLALEIPPSAEGPGPNGDVAVTLKLDVLALDNKSNVSNDFNRTDDITICYRLTNTMKNSEGDIARNVNINTKLSNIFYLPKKDIQVNDNKPNDNDGNNFYLEWRINSECKNETDKCVVKKAKIDKNGNLEAHVKFLHPKEKDVVYINYSSKISKDSPTGNDIKCSDINDSDVIFKRYCINPLELIVSNINISNNNPRLHNWKICPAENEYIIKNFTKENIIYYTVTQDAELEISYNISDIETDTSSILIKLYDIHTDENEHNISEIPIKNGKFVLNTLGNHSIEIEVFDGETNYSELWNGKIEILNKTSEEYHLDAALDTHNTKNTLKLILFCGLVLFVLIYVPQAPRMTSRSKLASIINDPIIRDFLLYITLLFSILPIICSILINNRINLQDIYKYEFLVYGFALTFSIILINKDINKQRNQDDESESHDTENKDNDTNMQRNQDDKSESPDTENKGSMTKYDPSDWYLAGIISLILLVLSHLIFHILIINIILYSIVAFLLLIIIDIGLRRLSDKISHTKYMYIHIFIIIVFILGVLIYHQSVLQVKPNYYFRNLFIFYLFQLLLLFTFLITPIEPFIKDSFEEILKDYLPNCLKSLKDKGL